ncbi:lipid A biosynthesis lauroyl acyltransferase [Ahrensia kielensis]|uniref:Lipid A biosynthesis lauroyl acyltransferase n=1 Tax=Ahrensia kielensis TaxID=76980 RepID=A0ABU9T4S3_9HYPH|nr:lipid A biosynthesis lauroyl acyltransferase [Ahrensia kielensis]
MSWKIQIFKAKTKLKHVRYWLEAKVSFAMLGALRLLPMKSAMTLNAKLLQFIGPFLPRHKMVIENLTQAFPEKDNAEIKKIARGMWRNIGRLISEYIYLDQLFDYDPDSDKVGLVEVEGEDIFRRLHAEGKPCIFFTGHVGNFELLPICAATYGLEVTALFRPPNNPYIAERLLASRTTEMGHLVPSKAGAAWGLARALDNGQSVGVLVDQKFARGIVSEFFGRPVRTNPLLPKLARQFNVPVYPARCIRLPGGRFRLILEEELVLPRDDNNEVDVAQSAQMLNDVVERWVRETPEQWMWLHRRWISNSENPSK